MTINEVIKEIEGTGARVIGVKQWRKGEAVYITIARAYNDFTGISAKYNETTALYNGEECKIIIARPC